jgi:hypothetical protein
VRLGEPDLRIRHREAFAILHDDAKRRWAKPACDPGLALAAQDGNGGGRRHRRAGGRFDRKWSENRVRRLVNLGPAIGVRQDPGPGGERYRQAAERTTKAVGHADNQGQGIGALGIEDVEKSGGAGDCGRGGDDPSRSDETLTGRGWIDEAGVGLLGAGTREVERPSGGEFARSDARSNVRASGAGCLQEVEAERSNGDFVDGLRLG